MKVTIVTSPKDSSKILLRVEGLWNQDIVRYDYYPPLSSQEEALRAFIGKELEGEIVFSNGFKIHSGELDLYKNMFGYKKYIKVTLPDQERLTDFHYSTGDQHAIDFGIWYSGMDREKVIKAYERWIKEKSV